MTQLRKETRLRGNGWLAAPLCSAILLLGCGGGDAPDPRPSSSSPDGAARANESNDAPSNDADDDLSFDDEATDVGEEEAGRRVVGYLPTYRIRASPRLHLDTLTHLNLAFVVPNEQGAAELPDAQPSQIRQIVADAHAAQVKVLAALAGGDGGPATKERLSQGVDSYVASVLALVDEYELDGVDIDIEGESIDPDTYGPLVRGLSAGLRNRSEPKLLTAAVAEYMKENYRALGAVDFLNIMSYDQCGEWSDKACEHSTLAQARSDLDYWSSFAQADEKGARRTIGAENVVLGVPFYGRCWGERCPERRLMKDGVTYYKTTNLTYSGIMDYCSSGRFSGCSSSADVLTDGDEVHGYYVSLNSPSTIKTKTEPAKQHGGIMIWELGQDATDAALFAEIQSAFPKRSRVSSGSD